MLSFLPQAAQKINTLQVSSTSVTINVLVESLHLPTFQSPRYQGTVTGVGNMAMDMKNEPLQFLATDADYAATGVNQQLSAQSQLPHTQVYHLYEDPCGNKAVHRPNSKFTPKPHLWEMFCSCCNVDCWNCLEICLETTFPCLCLISSAHLFFLKGLNPNIIYYVNGSSDFSIVGGYLFMTTNLTEATLNLQVR